MVNGSRWAPPVRISRLLFLLALLSVALMAARVLVSAQETEGSVSMVPSFSNVLVEEERFSVFIVMEGLDHHGVVSGVSSTGLGAFEFTLQFDPAVLQVAEVESGPTLEETGRSYQCLQRSDEPGIYSFGCFSQGSSPPGPQGDFTLAIVTFLPVDPGSTLLFMEAVVAGPMGDDVLVEVDGVGAVSVRGGDVATATPPTVATATATQRPAATATRSPGATATQHAAATATAPAAATATPSPTPDGATATLEPEGTVLADPTETDDGTPTEPTVLPADNSGEGGGSAGRVLLWSLAAVGSLAVAAMLGLAGVRWQRQRRA